LPLRSANFGRQFVTQPGEPIGGTGLHPQRGTRHVVRQIARDRHQRIAHGVGATGNQCDGAEGRKILPLRQEQAKVRGGEL
jgi:hypothetical protein